MTSEKGWRRILALLAACELAHWRPVLRALLARYDGLETLVDEERHAPVAALLHLLRGMARVSARPSDEEFAALVARLEFLEYRIRRSTAADRLTFEDGATWDPTVSDLRAFAAGRPLGGWRAGLPLTSQRQMAMTLLAQLRQSRRRNDRAG